MRRISTPAERKRQHQLLEVAKVFKGSNHMKKVNLVSRILKQKTKMVYEYGRVKSVDIGPSPLRQYYIKRIRTFGNFTPIKRF